MIFLDNASTTKVHSDCMDIFSEYSFDKFYNPSSLYGKSVEVKNKLKQARTYVLNALRGDGSIVFTSGGTESANIAINGAIKKKNSRIVTSKAEHPAVKNTIKSLKEKGYDVVECDVDICGRVDIKSFEKLVDKNTSLVSIIHVNNETGGINDIKKLCSIAKQVNNNIIFHSDGVQAVGKVLVDLRDLGVDLYSMSSHKIHAPKGAGALFVKDKINLNPIMFGGLQEMGFRPSTENVAGIMCFCHMLKKSIESLDKNLELVQDIKDYIINNIDFDIIKVISDDECSPYIVALALKDVRGEVMLHSLEKYGIMIGTGSACSSGKKQKGHWLSQFLSHEYINGKIRLSFSHENTLEQAKYFINQLNLEYSKLKKYL